MPTAANSVALKSRVSSLNSEPRRKPKLAQIVAAQILDEIIRRGWPTGKSLGTEKELIERHAVSRATIREAIRQIERQGAATMRRGYAGGLIVSEPPRSTTVRALATYFDLADITFEEQSALRLNLEIMAARYAAERLNDAGIQRLRSLVDELEGIADFVEGVQQHFAIRTAIAESTGNPALPLFVQALDSVILKIYEVAHRDKGFLERDRLRSLKHKRDLVGAIVAHDGARAEMLVRQDVKFRERRIRDDLKRVKGVGGRQHDVLNFWNSLKLGDMIARRIIDDIRKTGGKEGRNIGPEPLLQVRFGVSRETLREGIRLLELHGLVETRSGLQGGLLVGRANPHHTVETVKIYLRCMNMRMSHLWEVQSALEINAAEALASRVTSSDILEFEDALAELLNANSRNALAVSAKIHMLIAEKTGNRALSLFVRILLEFGVETLPALEPARLKWLQKITAALVAALRAKDVDLARRRMIELFAGGAKWIGTVGDAPQIPSNQLQSPAVLRAPPIR
jgi:DNA-binding FadR family transcriptional regulator